MKFSEDPKDLVGPFPATTHPVRPGVYRVVVPLGVGANRFAFFRDGTWSLCCSNIRDARWQGRHMRYASLSSMMVPTAVWYGLPKPPRKRKSGHSYRAWQGVKK